MYRPVKKDVIGLQVTMSQTSLLHVVNDKENLRYDELSFALLSDLDVSKSPSALVLHQQVYVIFGLIDLIKLEAASTALLESAHDADL